MDKEKLDLSKMGRPSKKPSNAVLVKDYAKMTITDLSKKYGVSRGTINNWIKQAQSEKILIAKPNKKSTPPSTKVLKGNLNKNNLVQKSDPLRLMRTVPFNLGELKILDTYLSRINSHDNSKRVVVFTKKEYEELMGFDNLKVPALKNGLKSMLEKVAEIPLPNKGFMLFNLFESASCEKNKNDIYEIELECTTKAKQLFFNIEELGYLKYELNNILSLTSKYSYLLYLYLKKELYRASWSVDLTYLREQVFDLKKNEYYCEFRYFKREILEKSLKEINDKTDIKFDYKAIKSGKYIVSIEFKLMGINRIIRANDVAPQKKLTSPEVPEVLENQVTFFESEIMEITKNEFDENELECLFELINNENNNFTENEQKQIFQNAYQKFCYYQKKNLKENKKIKSKYVYFRKILDSEIKEIKNPPTKKNEKTSYNVDDNFKLSWDIVNNNDD